MFFPALNMDATQNFEAHIARATWLVIDDCITEQEAHGDTFVKIHSVSVASRDRTPALIITESAIQVLVLG
tara:strand:+ start:26220 stop:26432 length:213 start_codon:yes stop_codon:yes gene_type:complete